MLSFQEYYLSYHDFLIFYNIQSDSTNIISFKPYRMLCSMLYRVPFMDGESETLKVILVVITTLTTTNILILG